MCRSAILTIPSPSSQDDGALWFSLFLDDVPFPIFWAGLFFIFPLTSTRGESIFHILLFSKTLPPSDRPQTLCKDHQMICSNTIQLLTSKQDSELHRSDLLRTYQGHWEHLGTRCQHSLAEWGTHGTLLPAAALGSPGQSARSAACENASCPSPGAANQQTKGTLISDIPIYPCRPTTFLFHFKD